MTIQKKGTHKVVAIGDSITFGDELEWITGQRWTRKLGDLTGHAIINRGVNGDTTRLGLERFTKDVTGLKPEIVLIQFGFNDCNRWASEGGLPRVSVAAFKANLDEMCERVRRFNAKPILLGMFPCSLFPAYREWQAPYIIAARQVEASYCPLVLIDDFLLDGLHPSALGHEEIAKQVAQCL